MGTADLTDVAKARDAVEDATRTARRQLDQARHDLADRAGAAKDELEKHAGTARDSLRDRLDDVDLEPRVRQAKIGFWSVVRAAVGALVAVPGVVTRGLGSLSDVADDTVERSSELTARSRRIARSVPITKAGRRRARARTAGWALGGFAVGAAAGAIGGYVLGRQRPELADQALETARATSERAKATAGEAVERVRTVAEERIDAGRDAAEDLVAAREALEEGADEAADNVAAAAERVASGNGEAAERGTGR